MMANNQSAGEVVIGCVVAVAIVAVVGPLSAIIEGAVLVKLWAWFVVPRFGVAPLTIAPAIGLSVLVGLLTMQYVPPKDGDIWSKAAYLVSAPGIAFVVGYIAHLFA